MNIDFDLLLKLKELESETNFKIEQDKNNKNLFYLTEPNATIPFATLDYNKESENARDTRTNFKTSTLRECSDIFLEGVRGIIKERENRSRAEISRSEETRTRDRQLCAVYGNQIWNQVSTREERDSAEQLRKKVETQKESLKQSQSYKQRALKSYQKSGAATLAPNTKNLQNEITSSLNKEDSSNNSNHQENSSNQSNQSKLFSNFTNKLNDIHQNLTHPIDTISLNDTLEVDKAKPQDNQESQDSYLKHNTKLRGGGNEKNYNFSFVIFEYSLCKQCHR